MRVFCSLICLIPVSGGLQLQDIFSVCFVCVVHVCTLRFLSFDILYVSVKRVVRLMGIYLSTFENVKKYASLNELPISFHSLSVSIHSINGAKRLVKQSLHDTKS